MRRAIRIQLPQFISAAQCSLGADERTIDKYIMFYQRPGPDVLTTPTVRTYRYFITYEITRSIRLCAHYQQPKYKTTVTQSLDECRYMSDWNMFRILDSCLLYTSPSPRD